MRAKVFTPDEVVLGLAFGSAVLLMVIGILALLAE
jgi:hypothetical protein